MNIKYALVLVNIILMFVVVLILFFREKSKSKKVQKEFADLKLSIEKTKEEINIETKIRQLKDKADSIIEDTNDDVKNKINSLSNKKIMEFEEYANQLFEKIEMNHKEVVFLYDMLNDKSESVRIEFAKLQELKKQISEMIITIDDKIIKDSSIDDKCVTEKEEFKEVLEFCEKINTEKEEIDRDERSNEMQNSIKEDNSDYQTQNEKIIKLYSLGYSAVEISKKLGIGTGEVALVNNLYKNRVIV